MTYHELQFRIYELADQLSAGCDPDFDQHDEELEREFQELRLQLNSYQ